MPMSAPMFASAMQFLRGAATDDLAAFAKLLNDTGLACLHGGMDEIEWWNADTMPQKRDLLAAVKPGARQAECKNLLADYMFRLAPNSDTAQPFVTDEFDRSGWFKYYYAEAANVVQALPPADKKMLTDITNIFFYRQMKTGAGGGAPGLKIPYESVPDVVFRGILYEIMCLGFERIPATCEQAIAGSASDAAIIGKMLWAGDAATVQGTQIKVVKVKAKWRGDSRKYADIKASNGFTTKAQSEGYARGTNLSASWHPMSTDFGRRWLWFRKAQKDNCLYSVVSVGKAGKEWKTYLPYPLIKLSGGKVTGLRGYLGTRKVKCVPAAGGAAVELALPLSETYLYLFVLAGLALDTGAMQGKADYPEMGVGDIPFNNVFGAVRFLRYHLGDETVTDDEGVLAVRDGVDRNDENGLTIKASYGQALFDKMNVRFDTAAKLATPVAVKWSGSGDGFVDLLPFQHPFTYAGKLYKIASPFVAT